MQVARRTAPAAAALLLLLAACRDERKAADAAAQQGRGAELVVRLDAEGKAVPEPPRRTQPSPPPPPAPRVTEAAPPAPGTLPPEGVKLEPGMSRTDFLQAAGGCLRRVHLLESTRKEGAALEVFQPVGEACTQRLGEQQYWVMNGALHSIRPGLMPEPKPRPPPPNF